MAPPPKFKVKFPKFRNAFFFWPLRSFKKLEEKLPPSPYNSTPSSFKIKYGRIPFSSFHSVILLSFSCHYWLQHWVVLLLKVHILCVSYYPIIISSFKRWNMSKLRNISFSIKLLYKIQILLDVYIHFLITYLILSFWHA